MNRNPSKTLDRLKLATVLLISITFAYGEQDPGEKLSVWDAVAIALQKNPDISLAAARIQEAQAVLEETHAAYYPTLSVDSGYLRSNAPSVVFGKTLDQRMLNFPNVNFNNPKDIDNFESGATLRYGFYTPGRHQRTAAANYDLSAKRFGRTAIENNLVDAVVKAYYSALETEEMIRTAEASVTTIKSELRNTRVRFKGGAALETDMLSLEVRLAGAKENFIQAQNTRSLAISTMANLMGLSANAPLQLSGKEWSPRTLPTDYKSGLMEAIRLRAELQEIRAQIQSADFSKKAVRRTYYPRVDGIGRGYMDADNFDYNTANGNWLVGVTLSLDVFDGHRKRANVSKAMAIQQQLSASEKKLLQRIELEVKQAYIRLAEAQERVKVTTAAVVQAEKVLQLVKKQFEGGAATITRYLETELSLTNARFRATAAKYDMKKAMAEIGRSIGYCITCAREVLKGE